MHLYMHMALPYKVTLVDETLNLHILSYVEEI